MTLLPGYLHADTMCTCLARMEAHLLQTSHSDRINDLAFPHEFSDVFATAGIGDIRVWHTASCRELLRIRVPNLECLCIAFARDGGSIISGWSDGM